MKMKPTKKSDGSNTKPYNVRLMTPAEIAGLKESKSRKKSSVTSKPTAPKSKASKTLTGPAAIKAIQKRTSPEGVKKYDKDAKKALEKKYPGLYKKTK
jgi:hypothetical protein